VYRDDLRLTGDGDEAMIMDVKITNAHSNEPCPKKRPLGLNVARLGDDESGKRYWDS
jgi:hypothetical protein